MRLKLKLFFQGDSGGSFACVENGVFHLQGVTSLGNPLRGKPAVFTDVYFFKQWIENTMREN